MDNRLSGGESPLAEGICQLSIKEYMYNHLLNQLYFCCPENFVSNDFMIKQLYFFCPENFVSNGLKICEHDQNLIDMIICTPK